MDILVILRILVDIVGIMGATITMIVVGLIRFVAAIVGVEGATITVDVIITMIVVVARTIHGIQKPRHFPYPTLWRFE
jgi:hypothetical protein